MSLVDYEFFGHDLLSSGNVKRPNEAPSELQADSKKPKLDQTAANQQTVTANHSKELEELAVAEKQFDEQFTSWEAQFNTWRQQNANHPDIEQYKAYEAKWASWREQLLARREQMKKKREKLTEAAASVAKPEPLSQPPDPSVVLNTATVATATPQMYPGYTTPSVSSVTPTSSQYPTQFPQAQAQFIPPYLPPSGVSVAPPLQSATLPTSSQPITTISASRSSDQAPVTQNEFLKSSSSNGIPGLDLLSGGSSQADVKNMPAVSFATSSQLPIQTPADNKPFDFPPPRQGTIPLGGQSQQGGGYASLTQQTSSLSGQPTSSAYSGIMPPTGIQPPGFPQGGFSTQPPSTPNNYPGPPQSSGAFQSGFANQPPTSTYQNQTPPTGNYQTSGPTPGYQGPTAGGFQQGAPPTSGFQAQASTTGYQPPTGGFQGQSPFQGPPPPGGFPPISFMPPGSYQGGFPPSTGPPPGTFPNQQAQPGSGFQDPTQQSGFPFQQPPGGTNRNLQHHYPSASAADQDSSKKLPGLMDNVLPSGFQDQSVSKSENRGENFDRNHSGSDKFHDRFGDPASKDRFGDKPPARFGESGFNSKDVGYSIPKPKGYFSMQEMSVEEEYEKFHEYQQGMAEDEEEDKDGRKSRFNDSKSKPYDDRGSRYERNSRFDDGKQSRFEQPRSRFDDGRSMRYDGGRQSRFEDAVPNRFPQHDRALDSDNFNRSFEKDPKGPPPSIVNPPPGTPTKMPRSSRWGAPENTEIEREAGVRAGERRMQGGGIGPPYGPTPDGLNFLFSMIIDYNHSPANLGVPDYFEPITIIDYTHGLNGIQVEENPPKELWDSKGKGGRVPSPQVWDRDDRINDRGRRRDDRSGGGSRGGPPPGCPPSGGPPGPPGGPPPPSRWLEQEDKDLRRRGSSREKQHSSDSRSRSPDRGRQSDRMSSRDSRDGDRDRRTDRKDSDRDRGGRSRSPPKENKLEKASAPLPIIERQVVPIDDILIPPGRATRPPKIVIFLRGPPGSGKSYLAKLIKDKEVKNGGTAPRILSLDDYFMTDVEKEEVDPDTGRSVKKKVMEYEFEPGMEVKYRESLNKCFRKTVTDGYFPFIIIDANNDKVSYFESMVNFCKVRGFAYYIIDLEHDVSQCARRNIHNRTEKDIQAIVRGFEKTPPLYKLLDIRSLLQEASIAEVDMEDSMDLDPEPGAESKPENKDDNKPVDKPEEKGNGEQTDTKDKEEDKEDKATERAGFGRFTMSSKWDDLDSSCSKLDRLDGFTSARKSRPTIQDWLQIPDEDASVSEPSAVGSKKRVRWADVEERSKQAKMKAMGFVVGHTDWSRMMDPTSGESKLTQTKYI